MRLKFIIQTVRVEQDHLEGTERLHINIVHDEGDQYIIIKPLLSGGYKTLIKLGAGYEWAYLPSRDVVRGTLQECQETLEQMYG